MAGFWQSAASDGDHSALKVWNPRFRSLGWVLIVAGTFFLLSSLTLPDIAAAVGMAAIAISLLIGGLALLRGGVLRIDAEHVDLRSYLRTRTLPCVEVASCTARVGSQGLIYTRAYPVFTTKSGTEIPFNTIQWSPNDLPRATAVCDQISEFINAKGRSLLMPKHGIVEGEPGVFPANIARFYQRIGQSIRRLLRLERHH